LSTAKKWLQALKVFADEQGEHVKWEIVDLRKSSALIEVRPVKLKSHKPAAKLVKKWEEGLRKIEKTVRPPATFTRRDNMSWHTRIRDNTDHGLKAFPVSHHLA
jgi:hypothetical protein